MYRHTQCISKELLDYYRGEERSREEGKERNRGIPVRLRLKSLFIYLFIYKQWNRFNTEKTKVLAFYQNFTRILHENERKIHHRKILHPRFMQTDCLFQLRDFPVTIGYNIILQLRILCSWLREYARWCPSERLLSCWHKPATKQEQLFPMQSN